MIESRYSIEYIDPNAEKPSSKLGRFLIYSTLTISIIAAIGALVFSNLPNNASQVFTNKIQEYIGSLSQPSKGQAISTEKKTISLKPSPNIVVNKTENKLTEEKAELKLIATQLENEYKKEVERLSLENTTQHNETVKQLSENQTLTKKIEVLSTQLKDEIQKNTSLEKEVATLKTESKSISSLLKKAEIKAQNYADKIKGLEQKEIKMAVQQNLVIEEAIPEPIEQEELNTEEVPPAKEKALKETINASTNDKNKAPVSQIDAIVAAMEAANTSSSNTTKTNNTEK